MPAHDSRPSASLAIFTCPELLQDSTSVEEQLQQALDQTQTLHKRLSMADETWQLRLQAGEGEWQEQLAGAQRYSALLI